MKRIVFFTLLSFCILDGVFASEYNIKEEIERLDNAIGMRPYYERAKRMKIDSLKAHVFTSDNPYQDYKNIYEEYRSYNYDTALVFAQKMQEEAIRLGDENYQIESAVANAFVYMSGGLFMESYNILSSLQQRYDSLPDEYYFTFIHLLWEMADYAGAETYLRYDSEATSCLQQVLCDITPSDSARYWFPLAVMDSRQHNYESSVVRFQEALLDSSCSEHARAVLESSLAFALYQLGRTDQALHYYINAAIYNVRTFTYGTTVLPMVAEILYRQGETALAEQYIRLAMEDATYYHARHRKVGISQLLPIIEEKYNEELLTQRHIAYILLVVVVILLIGAGFAMRFIVKRSKAIHAAQHTIHDMNQKLLVANILKEEMLSRIFVFISHYLKSIEHYQQDIRQHAINRRYNELMTIPRNVDAHMQRANLERKMDEMLLDIYPSFVQDFNALLRKGEQYVIKPDELLNTQMRIFALIRLGVVHNELIAEILDCSVNTVYTYKTRTIARSDLNADEFHEALMRIPSFSSLPQATVSAG